MSYQTVDYSKSRPNLDSNKEVDNEYRSLPGNFTIRQFNGVQMRELETENFVKTVYNNFIELARYPDLNHSIREINRLITSPKTVLFFVYNGHKMIAYAIAEVLRLDDGRLVLYLSYIYVAMKYRRHGIGSALIKQVIMKANEIHVDAIILTSDTQNENLLNFYLMRGFMYDPYLRRYDRHDVFSLTFN